LRQHADDCNLGGGVRARMTLTLPQAEGSTRLLFETDLAVLSKIGEFGQPVVQKKADVLREEFARNLRAAVGVESNLASDVPSRCRGSQDNWFTKGGRRWPGT